VFISLQRQNLYLCFQYIDQVGRVLRVTENGDVCVQYPGCSDSWTFNAQALAKVVSTCVITDLESTV